MPTGWSKAVSTFYSTYAYRNPKTLCALNKSAYLATKGYDRSYMHRWWTYKINNRKEACIWNWITYCFCLYATSSGNLVKMWTSHEWKLETLTSVSYTTYMLTWSCFYLIGYYNDYAAATPSDFIKRSHKPYKMSTSHIHSIMFIHA